MIKFTKGMSYIVTGGNKRRYLVHQTGLKSWRATVFTHVINIDKQWDKAVLEGNATTLFEKLKELYDKNGSGVGFEVRAYNIDSNLRKDMFDVLMYGYFKDDRR